MLPLLYSTFGDGNLVYTILVFIHPQMGTFVLCTSEGGKTEVIMDGCVYAFLKFVLFDINTQGVLNNACLLEVNLYPIATQEHNKLPTLCHPIDHPAIPLWINVIHSCFYVFIWKNLAK